MGVVIDLSTVGEGAYVMVIESDRNTWAAFFLAFRKNDFTRSLFLAESRRVFTLSFAEFFIDLKPVRTIN